MKNIGGKIIAFLAAVIVAVCISNALFTVHVKEYVAVRQFGKIVKVISEPGLNFKIPFVQTTQRVSAATRVYDIAASDVITRDKKTMIADDYVLWRVVDPTKYIQTLNALDSRAQERIDASAYNATKNVISSMTQDEVIAARGEKLGSLITEESNDTMDGYGIEIIQTQIKALDLPEDNKDAVYQRMISERQNIAASYKAEGDSEAQLIRNETDKEVSVTKAEAKKEAAVIEAQGEAEYMRILQEAYNNEDKADFYNYIRSLDALKASLKGENKTIILDKDSELAKILYGTAE
ncbi:MAG: protease modulator HflC [Lachnospiraceae bacterium]|nr:protease modulator HflC [Lachnospiraceae bacterium]